MRAEPSYLICGHWIGMRNCWRRFEIPRAMMRRCDRAARLWCGLRWRRLQACRWQGFWGTSGGAGGAGLFCRGRSEKNTYGTGCFLLMNTVRTGGAVEERVADDGGVQVWNVGGLLRAGRQRGDCWSAGAMAAGQFGNDWKQAERLNRWRETVADNGGVYFVPAFSGLFAPYWKEDARGVIVGFDAFMRTRGIWRERCWRQRLFRRAKWWKRWRKTPGSPETHQQIIAHHSTVHPQPLQAIPESFSIASTIRASEKPLPPARSRQMPLFA